MNQVPLPTLITRVRRYVNAEGALAFLPDAEICDYLNVSLAAEFYDFVRQALGDQYFRRTYTFTTNSSQADPSTYDLPGDFLSVISVDCYLGTTIGPTQPKINARRYLEEERNVYSYLPLGWAYGGWILYSLVGNQIRFQPVPGAAFAVGLNYEPVGAQLSTTSGPNTIDDLNAWSEPAVCDAAEKCAIKMGRFDLAQVVGQRRDRLKTNLLRVLAMRHAGEPERPHLFNRQQIGDGWEVGGGGW